MGSLDATSEPPPAASEDEETVDSPPIPDNASDAFETVVDSSSASSAEDNASNRKLLSFDSCSSSISSSDATFEDPFQDSGNERHKPSLKFVATDHGEEPDGSEGIDRTSESPPVQVMERPAAKYRIPSSVFARKKSAGPVDWSMASNESLFSIHGMSFCNPDTMLWNSGELGIQFSHSPENQFLGGGAKEEWKSVELDKTGKSHESGEADEIHESGKMNHDRGSTASAVLSECQEDQGSKTSAVDGSVSLYSPESGTIWQIKTIQRGTAVRQREPRKRQKRNQNKNSHHHHNHRQNQSHSRRSQSHRAHHRSPKRAPLEQVQARARLGQPGFRAFDVAPLLLDQQARGTVCGDLRMCPRTIPEGRKRETKCESLGD